MFEEVDRFLVQETSGRDDCTADEVYVHLARRTQEWTSKNLSRNSAKVDEFTWPFLLKTYVVENQIQVSCEREVDPARALLDLCDAYIQEHWSRRSFEKFRERTAEYFLSHTRSFLETFLLFGGKSIAEDMLRMAHHVYSAGPSGIAALDLVEKLALPQQKVIATFQTYLNQRCLAVVHRDGHVGKYVHLKWMYSKSDFSVRALCSSILSHQSGSQDNISSECEDRLGGNLHSHRQACVQQTAVDTLRCDSGNRVWNYTFFRQTHVSQSAIHQVAALYRKFPNIPVGMKTTRFFTSLSKASASTLPEDLFQLYETKFMLYKNQHRANLLHAPSIPKQQYTCRVKICIKEEDDRERSYHIGSHQTGVIDVECDELTSNMIVRTITTVETNSIVSREAHIVPFADINVVSWLPNESEASRDFRSAKSYLRRSRGQATHYRHAESLSMSNHVVRISHMNGYKSKLIDRIQLLHEHITRIVFERVEKKDRISKLPVLQATVPSKNDGAYSLFLKLHSEESPVPDLSLETPLDLQSILNHMDLKTFCELFRGEWDFGGILQGQLMQLDLDRFDTGESEILSLKDLVRFVLPNGLKNICLSSMPALRTAPSTSADVHAQLFLMLRQLHHLSLIHADGWNDSLPQGSSTFFYRFPLRDTSIEAPNDDSFHIDSALINLWEGIRKRWMKHAVLRRSLLYDKSERSTKKAKTNISSRVTQMEENMIIREYRSNSISNRESIFTIPWWLSTEYSKIVKKDIFTTPRYESFMHAALPEVERLFHMGKTIHADNVREFFEALNDLNELDEFPMKENRSLAGNPDEGTPYTKSSLSKHYSEELILFALTATYTNQGKSLRNMLGDIFQHDSGLLKTKKIAIFRQNSKNTMNLTYLRGFMHAGLTFFTQRGVPSRDLPLYAVKLIVYGILDLFYYTGIRESAPREPSPDAALSSVYMPLSDICRRLSDAHFNAFVKKIQCSYEKVHQMRSANESSFHVDWTGVPLTWNPQIYAHQKREKLSATHENIHDYTSTYLHSDKVELPVDGSELGETTLIVDVAQWILSRETENAPSYVENLRWITRSLCGETALFLQGAESKSREDFQKAFVQHALENGYEKIIRCQTLYPQVDMEKEPAVIPKIVSHTVDHLSQSDFDPSHISNAILWSTLNEHLSGIGAAESSENPTVAIPDVIEVEKSLQRNREKLNERIRAEIGAHLLLFPGSEEFVIYDAVKQNISISHAQYQEVVRAMATEGVLDMESYRARSSRSCSAYPLWLRAYSLNVSEL